VVPYAASCCPSDGVALGAQVAWPAHVDVEQERRMDGTGRLCERHGLGFPLDR
jgi:hypothetical protein